MLSLRAYASSVPFVAATAVLTLACDNPTPGKQLGTYSVGSVLSENTCGSDVAPTDPGSFDVTISNDDGTYYWFPNTGGSSVSGTMNSARTVSVTEIVADDVDGTDASIGPCVLQRNDTLTFTLGAGATPAAFTGAYRFTVSPAIGANCSDQLASGGGGYAVLPCTTAYTLTGRLQQ